MPRVSAMQACPMGQLCDPLCLVVLSAVLQVLPMELEGQQLGMRISWRLWLVVMAP